MENSLLKAYAEVDEILSFMQISYVEKIPINLREIFKNQKLKDYNPNIDKNIPLSEQNLERKTYAILAKLNLEYWCDDEESQELLKVYSDNEEKNREELRKKYNPDNIFKSESESQEKNIEEVIEIAEYKEENFIKKILNRIKKLFKI